MKTKFILVVLILSLLSCNSDSFIVEDFLWTLVNDGNENSLVVSFKSNAEEKDIVYINVEGPMMLEWHVKNEKRQFADNFKTSPKLVLPLDDFSGNYKVSLDRLTSTKEYEITIPSDVKNQIEDLNKLLSKVEINWKEGGAIGIKFPENSENEVFEVSYLYKKNEGDNYPWKYKGMVFDKKELAIEDAQFPVSKISILCINKNNISVNKIFTKPN